jgi:dTDP-4-dehydrorhamnose reductase
MRIVVTGASGQLGHDLVDNLRHDNEVFPFDLDLDITDAGAVDEKIVEIKPDAVINAAAYTDVDGCELHPDLALKVNADGAENLSLACRKTGAIMVHVSTDFVFDGNKKQPYTEDDKPNPINMYGRSKLVGEEHVRSLLSSYYIVRTAWLFGMHGANFVKSIIRSADEKGELAVVTDQAGSPTYSRDLAEKIAELMKSGFFGLYHITNAGICSWFEFAEAILAKSGRGHVKIRPITSGELDRPAIRPAYSVLKNGQLEKRGIPLLRPYEEALEAYFKESL